MKVRFKTDGLTGDQLKFVEGLNQTFESMPDSLTKEQVQDVMKETFKSFFNEKGEVNVSFLEDIKAFKGEMDEAKEGSIKAILKTQGQKLTEISNQLQTVKSVNSFDEFLEELKGAKGELDTIKMNKAGQKAFHIKAATITSTTTSIGNDQTAATAQRLGDGPLFTMQRGRPFILDFVNTGNTNQSAIIWFDEQQREGDFAITAEGAIKPLVQYKITRKSADYKKVAGRTTITEEFDQDYPRVVSTIRKLMQIDCRNEMNAVILADLITNAGAYAYNGLDDSVDNADNFAAIGAAVAQLQSLFYVPNVLVLNPADAWKMRLQRDTTGQWILPPFDWNGTTYEFGQIIVDPRVAAGNFFVGDGSVYNVDLKGDIIVRIGYANDDFIRNQYSMVVEQYFFNYISTARKAALIYGNFDAIKADIETP